MVFPKLVSFAILLSTLSVSDPSGLNTAGDDSYNILNTGRKFLRPMTSSNDSYCESWKLSIEVGAAGAWDGPPSRCEEYVENYLNGGRYLSDSELITDEAITFAKSVNLTGDGKDAWVFDVDETLISNIEYYAEIGYGADKYNYTAFEEFEDAATAPALNASLRLYNELLQLNFTIFVLTGRSESLRNVTEKNLLYAGYDNWESLIMKGDSDEDTALVYKSSKRVELVAEGYTIHGSSGDQWSDLLGNATAVRSFKIPNPMYYVA